MQEENPVHLRVDAITQGFNSDAGSLESAIEEAEESADAGVNEPMILGGADAPIMREKRDDIGSRSLAEFAAKPEPKKARRGFAGFFGRAKREPKVEAKREPAMQMQEPVRERAASAQTIGVHAKPQGPKISVTKQSPAAAVRVTPSAETAERSEVDLFGAENEQRRASIPAFLQAQDRPAGTEEDDRFEIPAFLRRQAGSGK
jgi:hypothetical protein